MTVVKNVGTMDAYLRVTGGLMMLAFGTAAMVRRPGLSKALIMGLGAAKVAEGITRYDPMYRAIGWSTLEKNPMNEMADMVTGATSTATHQATQYIDEMSHHAGHAVDDMMHQAGRGADRMAHTAERLTDTAERAGDRASRTTSRIVRKAEDYMS